MEVPVIIIHNSSFHSIGSRNMIFQICDKISEVLLEQYSMHKDISNTPFDKGLVMKLQYRINRSTQKTERSKKYKGGAYIDHLKVPCFTNKLRTIITYTRRPPISITLSTQMTTFAS